MNIVIKNVCQYLNSENKYSNYLDIIVPVVKLHNLAVIQDDVGAVITHRGTTQLTRQGEVCYDAGGVCLRVEALNGVSVCAVVGLSAKHKNLVLGGSG